MAEYSSYIDETGLAVVLDYCMERLLKSGYKVTRFRASTPLRDSVHHTTSTPLRDSVHITTSTPLRDSVHHTTSTPLRDSVQHTTSTPLHDYVHHTIPVPVMDSLPATRPGGPPERPPLLCFTLMVFSNMNISVSHKDPTFRENRVRVRLSLKFGSMKLVV